MKESHLWWVAFLWEQAPFFREGNFLKLKSSQRCTTASVSFTPGFERYPAPEAFQILEEVERALMGKWEKKVLKTIALSHY